MGRERNLNPGDGQRLTRGGDNDAGDVRASPGFGRSGARIANAVITIAGHRALQGSSGPNAQCDGAHYSRACGSRR